MAARSPVCQPLPTHVKCMSHIIINTPSVYSAKLPTKGWINLAQIRQLEVSENCLIVIITWQNGDKQTFKHDDAQALVDAWNEADSVLKTRISSHLQTNRRIK